MPRPTTACLLAILVFLQLSDVASAAPTIPGPVPPTMARRLIAPAKEAPPGTSSTLNDHGTNFTLFIPIGWKPGTSTVVAVHFHTAAWFTIQEHLRRGATHPLICFDLGQGSTTYRLAFEDTNRLARVVAIVEEQLRQQPGATNTVVRALEVSSFSAGYGAVRELLRVPAYHALIQTIILCDSMYGGLAPADAGSPRIPQSEHIDIWVPFAQAAARGEKTFVVTYSAVATTSYASTSECAAALAARLQLPLQPVTTDSTPAAHDTDYSLRIRGDRGNLHLWGYSGDDAGAHLTHVRHLADLYRAITPVP